MLTEQQIKYLCEIVRTDFDTSTMSKGSLIERFEIAKSMFSKIDISENERVLDLVRDIESDLKNIELW